MLRREYLRIVAGATASRLSIPLYGGHSLIAATSARVTGVQLYAVRAALKKDPDRVLQSLADIGFSEVEGFSRGDTVALAPRLKRHGLTLRSCQVETPLFTANWEAYPELRRISLPEAIDSLADMGAGYFTMGYISPGARGDNDDFFRRTADRMNTAAELGRKSGLRLAWQNHAFEFEGQPGQRPIDIYKERLDPRLVGLELNVFWASVAGQDPLRLLKEWKGRVPLLQLNDKSKDAPRQFSENIGIGAFVEAGGGDIDFPAILKTAPVAAVRFQFAGQDETEGDPIESLRRSFVWLNRQQLNR